ncbi:MAG: hypothetical protein F4206_02670 [Gammaproteobacteria bacterium]|nr:hypothetical protein [Gammaproteobacteria bacterium]
MAAPSKVGLLAHFTQVLLARKVEYLSLSRAWRRVRHGAQVVPPSTGGREPHLVHIEAACHSLRRRSDRTRALRRLELAHRPPYRRPALRFLWYRALAMALTLSPQSRHNFLPGAGPALPHLEHKFRARLSSAALR